jgi:hypothetical protein
MTAFLLRLAIRVAPAIEIAAGEVAYRLIIWQERNETGENE